MSSLFNQRTDRWSSTSDLRSTVKIAAFVAVLAMLLSANARGLEPGRHVSQYGHSAWRVHDGYFSGAPTSITQTQDGYIWIGTNSGLVRFDGVKFVPFRAADGESLRNTSIASLFSDSDGSLWIGTGSDLEHWQNGHLTHFPGPRGAFFGVVTKVFRSQDKTLWFSRRRVQDALGPVCSLKDSVIHCFNANDGVEPWVVLGILEDKDGSFWIHSDLSLFHWDPKTLKQLPEQLINVSESRGLQQITFDENGEVLMAMAQSGDRTGLGRLRNGNFEPFRAGTLDGQQTSATAMFLDSTHTLWIGTDSKGLYRVSGTQVDHYGSGDGLTDDSVNGFFEDREGNIWVTTNQGVDRFRNLPVTTFGMREGLSNSSVGAVMSASDGTLWISNFRSLDLMHPDGTITSLHGGKGFPGMPTGILIDGIVKTVSAGKGFPGQSVGSLLEDRKKRIWMGVDSHLQIFDGRTYTRLQKPNNRLIGPVTVMVEDRAGEIWALSVSPNPHGSLLHFVDDALKEQIPYEKLPYDRGGRALAADTNDGIWIYLTDDKVTHWSHDRAEETVSLHRIEHNAPSLTAIVVRSDGFVIGSSSLGLSVIQKGEARTLSVEQGLPCANIYALTDTDDALWLSSECGAIELTYEELKRWWRDPRIRPKARLLDALDGIRPASTANAATLLSPGSARSADGRIWFANSSVLQMIDPRQAAPRAAILPVRIEQLVADGTTFRPSVEVTLPSLTKDVQLDYTSPNFSTPLRLHFRYKLDGLEEDWVDSGNRRQTFYTNLRPGLYTFRVSASDGEPPWAPESTLAFRIPPRFYQTPWFILACVTSALLMLVVVIRWRVEAVKRDLRARLQVRLDERERIARDLHDTLFQSIQGVLLTIDNSTNTLAEDNPTRDALKEALRHSDQVMAESREHILELRAEGMERQSLGQVLTEVGLEFGKLYSPSFHVVELGVPDYLHPVVFEEMLRICREALFNAFRHSGANKIEVEIIFARAFSVRIADDGIGIDEQVLRDGGKPGHLGLKNMAQRAAKLGAKLTIHSRPKMGTEIELSMPRSIASDARRNARYSSWWRM
jgi:signal transduction histidine kinase/ligand-binding sensor domain-containing protein